MQLIITFLFLLACLIAYPAPCSFADGVSVREVSGNTIIPFQQNNIRMANETVWVRNERVTATFTFENVTDQQVGLRMGFPFRNGDDPLAASTFEYVNQEKHEDRI